MPQNTMSKQAAFMLNYCRYSVWTKMYEENCEESVQHFISSRSPLRTWAGEGHAVDRQWVGSPLAPSHQTGQFTCIPPTLLTHFTSAQKSLLLTSETFKKEKNNNLQSAAMICMKPKTQTTNSSSKHGHFVDDVIQSTEITRSIHETKYGTQSQTRIHQSRQQPNVEIRDLLAAVLRQP